MPSGIDVVSVLRLQRIFQFIDNDFEQTLNLLASLISIRSVISEPNGFSAMEFIVSNVKTFLEAHGAICEIVWLQPNSGYRQPILLAVLGRDLSKKTVLVYGHLDVCAAAQQDGWQTDPFVLSQDETHLYGRGVTDNKGPVTAWLSLVRAYWLTKTPLPVNLRFCFNTMEESDPKTFQEYVRSSQRLEFFTGIDLICVPMGLWLGESQPCILHAFRGYCTFAIEIKCAHCDLFTDDYCGTVQEAMADLIWILSQLVESKNKISPVGRSTSTTESILEQDVRDFNLNELKAKLGCHDFTQKTAVDALKAMWSQSSISIHGIEGAFYGSGTEIFLPGKVTGKFTLRFVFPQTPARIEALVNTLLGRLWRRRRSLNTFQVSLIASGAPWVLSTGSAHFRAAAAAIQHVYNVRPTAIQEGGHFGTAKILTLVMGKSMVILPIGQASDGAHQVNERISKNNLLNGIKIFAAYLEEVTSI